MTRARRRVLGACACLPALAAALSGCAGQASNASSTVLASGTSLKIYLSVPPGAASNPFEQDVIDAERLACREHAGEVRTGSVTCVTIADAKLSDNARAAISDKSAIAYVGELAPGSSDGTVGITNALDLPQISPTDTALELLRATPAVPTAPGKYYESASTYGDTFSRIVPSSGLEASALVAEMKALGLTKLYVSSDGSDYGAAIAQAVSSGASGTLTTTGESSADAIFYGAQSPSAAVRFFNSAAQADPGAKLFGSSSLADSAFPGALSTGAARALYISAPGFTPSQLPVAARAAFVAPFLAAYGHRPAPDAVFGYEAVTVLMHVLAQAGPAVDNRTLIAATLRNYKPSASILGSYSITGGDSNLNAFFFYRVRAGTLVPVAAG